VKEKTTAKSEEEFDRRFDGGEDIHDLVEMNRAKIIRHGKKVRITLDMESRGGDVLDYVD
jgi:hypothetical protein